MTGLVMTFLLLLGLLCTAVPRHPTAPFPGCVSLAEPPPRPHGRSPALPEGVRRGGEALSWRGGRNGRRRRNEETLPLLVQQLAGLLEAGRPPAVLWADAAALSRADGEDSAGPRADVLEAAARTARLGLSVAPVFQEAAAAGRRLRRPKPDAEDELRLWEDLAACVQVSELSGAPLAGLLQRYAAGMEADLDGRAARENAAAGPRATVRLMTWLPAGGLALGYGLGADPLGTLLGSGLGIASLSFGLILSLAGHAWTRRLLAVAGGAADP